MSESFFQNEPFQDRLAALLCRDIRSLKECAPLLSAQDFRPVKGMRQGRQRWIVVERALRHFSKHHEPIGTLLLADILEHAESINLGARTVEELKQYCTAIQDMELTSPDAVTSKVVRFKRDKLRATALQEMVEAQAAGMLTDAKWLEIHSRVMNHRSDTETYDYLERASDRIDYRRQGSNVSRVPWTFIDPLDNLVRCVGRGELGLVIAPLKRGKSLMMLWLAVAYVVQGLNVLFLTLEDPRHLVEDRLDSIVTSVPIKSLANDVTDFKSRFTQFRGRTDEKLKIFDGTGGGITMDRIDQIIMRERDHGFETDAVIIDYDDEIAPSTKQKDRRMEFADIYRDLCHLVARHHIIGWTASQTQRGTEGIKILSSDRVAEDISKIRKASMTVSMGKGDADWGNDSIYLWVAAHKFDMQHIGCHIVPDLDRMLIYDREATEREQRRHRDQ